jgi:hypothetical protein
MSDTIQFPENATEQQKEDWTKMQEELRRTTDAAVQLLLKAEIPFVLLRPLLGTTGIAVISNLNFDYQQLTIFRAMMTSTTPANATRSSQVKMTETDVTQ